MTMQNNNRRKRQQGLGMPMSMEMWPSQMPASGDPSDIYGQFFNQKINPYYPNQPHTASANPTIDYGAQGLGMPSAQGMFPPQIYDQGFGVTSTNPFVTYYPGDVGWKSELPEAQGMESIPWYNTSPNLAGLRSYRSSDPSVGDWSLRYPGDPHGYSAGEYFDPSQRNPYTRDIPMRQPANPTIDYGAQGLGTPTEQGMFPARENPNVRWSYGDQGWKTGLPDAAGVDPTPFYSGSYITTDPSVGDWRMQGPGSDLQQGFLAGEYFDPTITNPYTRNIPKKKPGGFGPINSLNQITGAR